MSSRLTTCGFWASGWRPATGWAMAAGILVQSLSTSFCMVYAAAAEPESADKILSGIATVLGASVAFWGAAGAVVGVAAWRRSSDKEADAKVAMARDG